jgi:hypothetical protein
MLPSPPIPICVVIPVASSLLDEAIVGGFIDKSVGIVFINHVSVIDEGHALLDA